LAEERAGAKPQPTRRWSLAAGDASAEERLVREIGVRRLLARLLVNRGLREPDVANAFLGASLTTHLRSPMLFGEMRPAAARLLDAIRKREPIAIYGDYDVDGITSSAALVLFLREAGCEPLLHIPHRVKDGYGLKSDALRDLASRGARLVITADCGAAAHAEVAEASRAGLELIICDHHQNPAVRPPACAVLNPVVPDAGFPFAGLCAAGVVFYLLLGTRMLMRESGATGPDLRRYLDLVALGTVADMVPILEENRVLVKYGLREMARGGRAGVRALLGIGVAGAPTVDTLGFQLGPRLNASGRLADARRAVELLVSDDDSVVRRIAAELDGQNRERRDIEDVMFDEADQRIRDMADSAARRSFVLASEGWHAGVVGIVASRLVERYYRPMVLLALEGDVARGSARGIPAIHLFEALRKCAALLERFGGHRMAAGLTVRADRLADFAARFEAVVAGGCSDDGFIPEIAIDDRIDLDSIDGATLEDIERLEPYGQGNPRPLFLAEALDVISSRIVGDRHLKLALRKRGGRKTFDAIAFRRAELQPPQGASIDVVFSPEVSRWDGIGSIQLVLRDLRKSVANSTG
jgi:single-stranded-DNA-specific exonuclease